MFNRGAYVYAGVRAFRRCETNNTMSDAAVPDSVKPEYHILLVEDLESDAYLASEMLSRALLAEYELVRVSSLKAAIDEIAAHQFTLVLLDLKLPDGAGVGNIDALRAVDHKLPIVVLSASDDPDTALQAIRAGAQDFLVKGTVSDWQLERAILYAIERRVLMNTVEQLTNLDQLTGLANRPYFMSRIEKAMERARLQGKIVVVGCFDIDNFRDVVLRSPDVGDEILTQAARRLESCIRDGDTVARLGGDEFGILLEGQSRREQLALTLGKISQEMSVAFRAHGRDFLLTLSGGIAIYPEAGSDVHALMGAALSSMRAAKAQGGDRYIFF